MKFRFSVYLMSLVFLSPAWAQQALTTWVTPDASAPGLLRVESGVGKPRARIINTETGEAITTVDALKERGWVIRNGFFENLATGQGGGKVRIQVDGLPKGKHRVFLRYFWQPRKRGLPWHYLTYMGVENGSTSISPLTLVAGLGGYDRSSVYESAVGDSNSETEADVWFYRYTATEFSRVGSVRIESLPSPDFQSTTLDTPANAQWRQRFDVTKAPWGALVAPSVLKVRPHSFQDLTANADAITPAIRLSAARGERESAQVLLYSPAGAEEVTWKIDDLQSDTGARLPGSAVDIFPVGYVVNPTVHDPELFGYWPDPLLPFLSKISLRAGMVQALWCRFNVPEKAAPGVYRGRITIQSGKPAFSRSVPVEIEVWDFALPATPGFRVVTGGGPDMDAYRVSYKVNPGNIYSWMYSPKETIPRYAKWPVTAINLAYFSPADFRAGRKTVDDAQLKTWVGQVGERLRVMREYGLEEKAYVYMFDEATPEWHASMTQIASALRAAYPDLLVLTTAMESHFNGNTDRIPGVNGWVPVIFDYRKSEAAETRNKGGQVWYYTCNVPLPPFPGLLLINTALESRILTGFMPFGYQVDGFIYYATSLSWGSRKITKGPFTDWVVVDNDHGALFQRGPSGETLPSIRMELLRDGIEDYDLAKLATDRVRERGSRLDQGVRAFVGALGESENPLLKSAATLASPPEDMEGHLAKRPEDRVFTTFERRPAEFLRLRKIVGDALNAMNKKSTP